MIVGCLPSQRTGAPAHLSLGFGTAQYARERDFRFMAAWVREEEKAPENRQRKRGAEEADKVEVAPGVTLASLGRFRPALVGSTQGLPKRRRLCL